MTIPSSHMESMVSMEQEIGWGLSQHSFHGFHMEFLMGSMDSTWNNLGKVKTSIHSRMLIIGQTCNATLNEVHHLVPRMSILKG